MRFVTGFAAGAGIGYVAARRHRARSKGIESTASPQRLVDPGPHTGAQAPSGGCVGPVLSPPVRPARLQGAPAGDALLRLAREHDGLRRDVDALIAFEPDGPHEKSDLRAAVQRAVSVASAHEAAEEEHLWPVVRRRLPEGEELAETGRAHELELKRILQVLDSRRPGDIDFDDLLRELRMLLEDHMAFEESYVWPRLDAALTEQERLDMGGRLGRAEESAPTRPHPSEFADPTKHPVISRGVALVDRGVDRVAARGRGAHD